VSSASAGGQGHHPVSARAGAHQLPRRPATRLTEQLSSSILPLGHVVT